MNTAELRIESSRALECSDQTPTRGVGLIGFISVQTSEVWDRNPKTCITATPSWRKQSIHGPLVSNLPESLESAAPNLNEARKNKQGRKTAVGCEKAKVSVKTGGSQGRRHSNNGWAIQMRWLEVCSYSQTPQSHTARITQKRISNLEIARKNGTRLLASALVLFMLTRSVGSRPLPIPQVRSPRLR